MKKFLLSLLSVFAATSAFAVTETQEVSLSKEYWPGISSYTGDITSKEPFLESSWKLSNFNNSNNSWNYIRCGYKSAATTATLENISALPVAVTKLVVNGQHRTIVSGVTIKLLVSSDVNFSENKTTEITSPESTTTGDWTFEIPEETINFNLY